jgi:hypothetical protein
MPSASPLSLADRDHPGTGGVGCAALHHRPPSLTPIPAYARPATTVPGSTVRGGRVGPGADHAWPFRVRAAELLTVRGSWRRPCDLSTTTLATTGHRHHHHHSHRWIINATERDGRGHRAHGHRAPGHRQESMTRPCYIDRGGMLLPTHPDVWPSLGSHRSAFIDESTPIGYDQRRFDDLQRGTQRCE